MFLRSAASGNIVEVRFILDPVASLCSRGKTSVMIKAKYAALVCGEVFPISDMFNRDGVVGEQLERSLTTREVARSRPGET